MTGRKHGDEPGRFDSPACSMHEADDAYMGFVGPDELAPLLQELLEAERAGARWRWRAPAALPTSRSPN